MVRLLYFSQAHTYRRQSSKISKVRQDLGNTEERKKGRSKDEEELWVGSYLPMTWTYHLHSSASQNDKLLHKLIHTKLLSGSLNPSLELSGAQRKKALAGRVLETAQYSKLGQGEKAVRTAEHNKAPKNIRFSIMDKAKERKLKELEDVNRPQLSQLLTDIVHRLRMLGTTTPL
jgi:hypothetical protein